MKFTSQSTAGSPACASTRARATPEPTSATCGPPAASSWPRPPSPPRPRPGGNRPTFSTPVPVTAGTTYVASYFAPNGNYAGDSLGNDYASADEGLDQGAGAGPLRRPLRCRQRRQRRSTPTAATPSPPSSFGATNYWVDAVLATSAAGGHHAAGGHLDVSRSTGPPAWTPRPRRAPRSTSRCRARPSPSRSPGRATFPCRAPRRYDSGGETATFTPSSPLASGTTYHAQVSGAADLAGNVQAVAKTWTFTTAVAPQPARGVPLRPVERPDHRRAWSPSPTPMRSSWACASTLTRTA